MSFWVIATPTPTFQSVLFMNSTIYCCRILISKSTNVCVFLRVCLMCTRWQNGTVRYANNAKRLTAAARDLPKSTEATALTSHVACAHTNQAHRWWSPSRQMCWLYIDEAWWTMELTGTNACRKRESPLTFRCTWAPCTQMYSENHLHIRIISHCVRQRYSNRRNTHGSSFFACAFRVVPQGNSRFV